MFIQYFSGHKMIQSQLTILFWLLAVTINNLKSIPTAEFSLREMGMYTIYIKMLL